LVLTESFFALQEDMESAKKKALIKWFSTIAFCVLVIMGFVLMAGKFPFYFDDAFISFRITENIKDGIGPFLFKDQKVYSSTSLIYPYFNLIPAFLHGNSWIEFIPYWNGVLIALSFCICLIKSGMDLKNGLPQTSILIIMLLPWLFGHRNLIYANSGLETGLYMASIAACLHIGKFRHLSPWLIFIRPEGWLAGLAVFIDSLLRKDVKASRNLAIGLVISLICWSLAGYILFGTPLPQSIAAKANHFTDRLNEIQKGLSYALFAGHFIPFAAFLFAFYRFRDYREKVRLSLIWTILYLGFFSFGAAWWPWYLPPLYAGFWYMSLGAGFRILRTYPLSGQKFFLLFTSFLIWSSWQLYSGYSAIRASSAACSKRMEASHNLAGYLSKNPGKESSILLEPLGMMAWFGPDLRILDYPGLANKEMAAFLKQLPWKIPHRLTDIRTDSAILEHFKPDALVLWPEEEAVFRRSHAFLKHYRISSKLPYFPEEKRMDSVSVFTRIKN
jgi:hypothetical protein